MAEDMICTVHPDGTVTAERFPDVIAVSERLMDEADPVLFRRDGDFLYFDLANGSAIYRLLGVEWERPGDRIRRAGRVTVEGA